MKKNEVSAGSGYFVALKNSLVLNGKFNLTPMEYNIVFYLISKIKPKDKPDTEYTFNVGEFIKVCGLNTNCGTYYKYVREVLNNVKSKTVNIRLDERRILITSWFNEAELDTYTGEIKINFPEKITPYLFNLQQQGNYLQFQREDGIALKSEYSKRLYLVLKAVSFKGIIHIFSIDELREKMECSTHEQFKDFKRYVLENAVAEINENTDLTVSYEVILKGRKATHIQFKVFDERTWDNV